jgi:multicomponent Na+:H+ antiporter subunit B
LKYLAVLVFPIVGALLLLGAHALPPLRTEDSPMSRHVEPYYVERTLEETATPNLVTAILADYRGYDTFGETTVIFAAGLSCYLLLRRLDS